MNERTRAQLRLMEDIGRVLDAADARWWLFGGWGLDARIGRVTRDHGDIEFWVERRDGDAIRDALVSVGATILDSQPLDESREFMKDGVVFSSAFFDRHSSGRIGLRGRWSDWALPPSSFDAAPGHLGDLAVPAMTNEGMLAMKEQFPSLRNGAPLRDKDIADIASLKRLLAAEQPA